jgi:hypothetical protein
MPWSAGYITNMFESEFSAHTTGFLVSIPIVRYETHQFAIPSRQRDSGLKSTACAELYCNSRIIDPR